MKGVTLHLIINVISNLPSDLLSRQQVLESNTSWIYSSDPVDADVYVVYGSISRLHFRNQDALRIFIALEPPEIFQYSLRALERYDIVLAPDYAYMKSLRNRFVTTGLLNWSISRPRKAIEADQLPTSDVAYHANSYHQRPLTTVISLKQITPLQFERINFVKYLKHRLPELQIYGREILPIPDKWEALVRSNFHLAIENSQHPGYWTEKLSDSLLSGTRTFYCGDPNILSEFSAKAVIPIDITDFEGSFCVIREHLGQEMTTETANHLVEARRYILEQANIHSRILQVLEETKLTSSSFQVSVIDPHPVSWSSRLKFLRSRLLSYKSGQIIEELREGNSH
jgi:hypothetical protein